MGVVKGISSTEFPSNGRDVGQTVLLKTRWGIYPAVIVRQDRDAPFNTIWRIDRKNLPHKHFKEGVDLYVSQRSAEAKPKDSPVCEAGPHEGRFVEVVFDFDLANRCEGVIVTERRNELVIFVLTGPHARKHVTSNECQYSIKHDFAPVDFKEIK